MSEKTIGDIIRVHINGQFSLLKQADNSILIKDFIKTTHWTFLVYRLMATNASVYCGISSMWWESIFNWNLFVWLIRPNANEWDKEVAQSGFFRFRFRFDCSFFVSLFNPKTATQRFVRTFVKYWNRILGLSQIEFQSKFSQYQSMLSTNWKTCTYLKCKQIIGMVIN